MTVLVQDKRSINFSWFNQVEAQQQRVTQLQSALARDEAQLAKLKEQHAKNILSLADMNMLVNRYREKISVALFPSTREQYTAKLERYNKIREDLVQAQSSLEENIAILNNRIGIHQQTLSEVIPAIPLIGLNRR